MLRWQGGWIDKPYSEGRYVGNRKTTIESNKTKIDKNNDKYKIEKNWVQLHSNEVAYCHSKHGIQCSFGVFCHQKKIQVQWQIEIYEKHRNLFTFINEISSYTQPPSPKRSFRQQKSDVLHVAIVLSFDRKIHLRCSSSNLPCEEGFPRWRVQGFCSKISEIE